MKKLVLSGLLIICITLLMIPKVSHAQTAETCDQMEDRIFPFLIKARMQFDSLLTEDERIEIKNIRSEFLNPHSVNHSLYDLTASRFVYYHTQDILNNHRKNLVALKKNFKQYVPLWKESLTMCATDSTKKQIKKLKFLTAPLPFLLLIDESFRASLALGH